MNDQDVLIKIITAYEAGGIEAAKQAAGELKTQVEANSDAGKALSGAFDLLNGKGQNAGQVFKGLSGIMKGGQRAASGLSQVIGGLGGALGMAAGPLAILTTGIGLAVTAWQNYKKEQEAAAEAAKKAAEEAAEAAKKHLEELDKVRLDAVNNAIKEMKTGLDEVAKAAQGTRKSLDALEDSELDVETAQIDAKVAAGEMTSEEGEYAKTNLKHDAADRKDQRELDDLQAEQDRLAQADADATAAAEEAAKELSGAEQALAQAEEKLAAANQKLKKSTGMFAYNDQKRVVDAAQKKRDEAAAAVEEAGTKKASADAALQTVVDERFDRGAEITGRMQVLQNNMAARSYRRQAADSKYDAWKKAETDKWAEESFKQQEEAAKARAAEAAAAAPKPTVRSLWKDAAGQIENAQDYKGRRYEGDAAGDTQQKAREALAKAGKEMAEGKRGDDAVVIRELIGALDEMGAVVKDRNKMLEDLKEAVSQMRSQVKNMR